MEIETDDIRTTEADDRGRLYLGTEYANKRITVAVVEVETDRPGADELAAAYRDAADSALEITDDWKHASDDAWDALGSAPGIERMDGDE